MEGERFEATVSHGENLFKATFRMNLKIDHHLASWLAMTRRIGKSLLKSETPIAANSKILELVVNSRGDIFQTTVDRENGRFYLWHKDSEV